MENFDEFDRYGSLQAQLHAAMSEVSKCMAAELVLRMRVEEVRQNKDGFCRQFVGALLNADYRAAIERDDVAAHAKFRELQPEFARAKSARQEAIERVRVLRREWRAALRDRMRASRNRPGTPHPH